MFICDDDLLLTWLFLMNLSHRGLDQGWRPGGLGGLEVDRPEVRRARQVFQEACPPPRGEEGRGVQDLPPGEGDPQDVEARRQHEEPHGRHQGKHEHLPVQGGRHGAGSLVSGIRLFNYWENVDQRYHFSDETVAIEGTIKTNARDAQNAQGYGKVEEAAPLVLQWVQEGSGQPLGWKINGSRKWFQPCHWPSRWCSTRNVNDLRRAIPCWRLHCPTLGGLCGFNM